jgi:hypothetical protein
VTTQTDLPAETPRKSNYFTYLAIGIVLFLWLTSTPLNNFAMNGEATAGQYGIIVREYPTISAPAKSAVEDAFLKGYLTRRDVSDLISLMIKERTIQGPASQDDHETESFFVSLYHQVVGGKADYATKRQLAALVHRQ